MPLACRLVEPVNCSRKTNRKYDYSEYESVTSNALCQILRQLAFVTKHAENIFGQIASEAQEVTDRSTRLQKSVENLDDVIIGLNARAVDIPVSTLSECARRKESWSIKNEEEKELFRSADRPLHIQTLYKAANLDPHSTEVKTYENYCPAVSGTTLIHPHHTLSRSWSRPRPLAPTNNTLDRRLVRSMSLTPKAIKRIFSLPCQLGKQRPKSVDVLVTELDTQTNRRDVTLPTPEQLIKSSVCSSRVIEIDTSEDIYVRSHSLRRPKISQYHGSLERKSLHKKKKKHRKNRDTVISLPEYLVGSPKKHQGTFQECDGKSVGEQTPVDWDKVESGSIANRPRSPPERKGAGGTAVPRSNSNPHRFPEAVYASVKRSVSSRPTAPPSGGGASGTVLIPGATGVTPQDFTKSTGSVVSQDMVEKSGNAALKRRGSLRVDSRKLRPRSSGNWSGSSAGVATETEKPDPETLGDSALSLTPSHRRGRARNNTRPAQNTVKEKAGVSKYFHALDQSDSSASPDISPRRSRMTYMDGDAWMQSLESDQFPNSSSNCLSSPTRVAETRCYPSDDSDDESADDNMSEFSMDQDGFFTSMHAESGLLPGVNRWRNSSYCRSQEIILDDVMATTPGYAEYLPRSDVSDDVSPPRPPKRRGSSLTNPPSRTNNIGSPSDPVTSRRGPSVATDSPHRGVLRRQDSTSSNSSSSTSHCETNVDSGHTVPDRDDPPLSTLERNQECNNVLKEKQDYKKQLDDDPSNRYPLKSPDLVEDLMMELESLKITTPAQTERMYKLCFTTGGSGSERTCSPSSMTTNSSRTITPEPDTTSNNMTPSLSSAELSDTAQTPTGDPESPEPVYINAGIVEMFVNSKQNPAMNPPRSGSGRHTMNINPPRYPTGPRKLPHPKLTPTHSRMNSPDSRLSSPDSRLSSPSTRLSSPSTRLNSPDSRLSSQESKQTTSQPKLTPTQQKLPSPESRLTPTDSRLTSADSRLTSADSRLTSTDSRLTSTLPRVSPTSNGSSVRVRLPILRANTAPMSEPTSITSNEGIYQTPTCKTLDRSRTQSLDRRAIKSRPRNVLSGVSMATLPRTCDITTDNNQSKPTTNGFQKPFKFSPGIDFKPLLKYPGSSPEGAGEGQCEPKRRTSSRGGSYPVNEFGEPIYESIDKNLNKLGKSGPKCIINRYVSGRDRRSHSLDSSPCNPSDHTTYQRGRLPSDPSSWQQSRNAHPPNMADELTAEQILNQIKTSRTESTASCKQQQDFTHEYQNISDPIKADFRRLAMKHMNGGTARELAPDPDSGYGPSVGSDSSDDGDVDGIQFRIGLNSNPVPSPPEYQNFLRLSANPEKKILRNTPSGKESSKSAVGNGSPSPGGVVVKPGNGSDRLKLLQQRCRNRQSKHDVISKTIYEQPIENMLSEQECRDSSISFGETIATL